MSAQALTDTAGIARRAVAVLGRRPAGLFTDIDGTISFMAPRPDEASVVPEARAALSEIERYLDMTGIVTGRALDMAMGLVQLPSLSYVGNHGLEWRIDGTHEDNPAALAGRGGLQQALATIADSATRLELAQGLLLEDKRLSATVHYRQTPNPERFLEEMLPVLAEVAGTHDLQLVPGRMIMELRPNTGISKGTALRDIVTQYGLKGVVFSGDDISDVEGFEILGAMRDAGTIDALMIGVVGPETPVRVRDTSDVHVADPTQMSAVLTEIGRRLAYHSTSPHDVGSGA